MVLSETYGDGFIREVQRLSPGQLAFDADDTLRLGGDHCRPSGSIRRRDHSTQFDGTVVAINFDRVSVGNSLLGERAFHLGNQQIVLRAFGRRIVKVLSRGFDLVMLKIQRAIGVLHWRVSDGARLRSGIPVLRVRIRNKQRSRNKAADQHRANEINFLEIHGSCSWARKNAVVFPCPPQNNS